MSEYGKIPLGEDLQSLDVSPKFDAYSGVEIIIDDKTSAVWPENKSERTSGRVLTVNNPWGDERQARAILEFLQSSGFRYQPYRASDAYVTPAAELGDGVTVGDVYSGIHAIERKYSPLMATDIKAPQDEEVDHEYPYEPLQDRVFKREIGEAMSQIRIAQNNITLEVSRATEAEGNLSSRITANANSISATVTQTGQSADEKFGWSLLSSGFTLTSNNKDVFKCTSAGITIDGTIIATTGTIGGFTIKSSAIYNKISEFGGKGTGVYIGTDGIQLGQSFKVTTSGQVEATNMKLWGTLYFWDSQAGKYVSFNANSLRTGAENAYNWASNGTASSWTSGAQGGELAKRAFNNNAEVSYLKASYLTCTSNYITVKDKSASWRTATLATPSGGQLTIYWLGQGGAIYN